MRVLKLEDRIYDFIAEECSINDQNFHGVTTNYISDKLSIVRSNVSAILNKLYKEGKIIKINGRPVLYAIPSLNEKQVDLETMGNGFNDLIGIDKSLKKSVQQARAAILYPPKGLHTLILGPTGVGKTMFAELMYKFAVENGVIDIKAPFITFNCADYSNNPQFLLSQLFGYQKGAYTGAEKNHSGIVEKADGGILFLDEVHRLPPEGQELLFYLIDKGQFSPMGDASMRKKVNVLIICATTEDKDSVLLQTFTRRIPMTINIPSLRDRTIKERFSFVSQFLKDESNRVHREIVVSDEVIKNLLSYNCPGNIGQLKSDIKIICANAFLDCIYNSAKKVEIEIIHLPEHVKKGMLYQKEYKREIEELINGKSKIYFTSNDISIIKDNKDDIYNDNFYERIEKRLKELEKDDYSEEDIRLIMTVEIENYFKSYINKLTDDDIEISKIIDKEYIIHIDNLLNTASKTLKKTFSTKIFYGLCLHFSSSIERLKNGNIIINHNTYEIIEKYPNEYKLCEDFCKHIEKRFNIKIPEDEIAYMTMFLSADKMEDERKGAEPVIIIAMHGRCTATSMAEVVNRLLGINTVLSYDMSLDKSSKICYDELKKLVIDNNKGAGVILLVDMGSLSMFGELISNETGIKIRTVDLVTTVTALEIARRAETEIYIDDICDSVREHASMALNYGTKLFSNSDSKRENVIVTLCTTGEGSAMKIKRLIEDNIDMEKKNIEIIPMAISDRIEMEKRLSKILKTKKIISIVGSIDPKIHSIPFISLADLIMFNKYDDIEKIINSIEQNKTIETYKDVGTQVLNAIKDDLMALDIEKFRYEYNSFISSIESNLNIEIDLDMFVALTFHISYAINSIIKNEKRKICKNKESFKSNYMYEMNIIKKSLGSIENSFNINISDDDICFILLIIKRL